MANTLATYRVNNRDYRERLEKAAYILKAVSHPVRLAIIDLLEEKEQLNVNEICEVLECEQSFISHHLINLKLRGILQSSRDGLNMYYALKERDVTKIVNCIENCGCVM
ncbi:MAG: metalloregulator ArsR/SmtB family transcription factor [Spirosomaceae bacterium]|nr:metalloregulator ArsR/SmtB family transcription factor [Spirosomataceae bacterium]